MSFSDSQSPETGANAESSSDETRVTAFVGEWWVLHTKSRNEKILADELARSGAQCFLPLVRCRRRHGDRLRQVDMPLFPGYVFLCGTEQDRLSALRTNRVARVLEVADQGRLRSDLARIQRVVESDVPVDLYPRLKQGARCRVVGGSLAGLEGVVLQRRGPWRVYVDVKFLGQSAELEIDRELLEVID